MIYSRADSFPKFYRYFPKTNETEAIFVMERIGRTLRQLWEEYRPFSSLTVTQIGLQIVSLVEVLVGKSVQIIIDRTITCSWTQ